MEKHHYRIKFTAQLILVLVLITIFSSCSRKNIKVYIEKGSTNKEYMESEKDIVFQYFFNDSIKVYSENKLLFSEFVKTNPKYQVAEKYLTIKERDLPSSNHVFIHFRNDIYKLSLQDKYSFYYMNFLSGKLTVVCTNEERKFY